MSRFWGQFIYIQSKEKENWNEMKWNEMKWNEMKWNEDYSNDESVTDGETENDKGGKSQKVFSIWPHFHQKLYLNHQF